MKNLEKHNIFQEPEGYFDTFPDRVLKRYSKEKTASIYRISFAAAAVIVLGIALFIFRIDSTNNTNFEANLDSEVNLYINAGYWNVEDVLSFSEDPDLILDEIIAAEWSVYQIESDDLFDEEMWF
jgi:hypothetical protein